MRKRKKSKSGKRYGIICSYLNYRGVKFRFGGLLLLLQYRLVYLKSDQDNHRLVGRRRLLGIANSKY